MRERGTDKSTWERERGDGEEVQELPKEMARKVN
jgi:hypothetical protein